MPGERIYFIISLLQDLNILRPLAYLAARETEASIGFLLTERFLGRDEQSTWQTEIGMLAREIGASVHVCASALEAFAILQGQRGLLIAGSESDLNAHGDVHNFFRTAPPGFIKITLQHGLECVGFRQNREHNLAHGRSVTFGADIVCAWAEPSMLSSVVASQRSKVVVTGPSTLLQVPTPLPDSPPAVGGLVCENLHSVRLRASGNHARPFMDTFQAFCHVLGVNGQMITLRPHPGGQYVIKNKVALPPNVVVNNAPIFRVDLRGFQFGISAPSTIVLDMVLAGIPVGVWRDPDGVMDASIYDGLTSISTLEEWVGFYRDAMLRPDAVLTRQAAYLDQLAMVRDPREIYRRFARLLVNATTYRSAPPIEIRTTPPRAARPPRPRPLRVQFLSNGMLPTLQLSFQKPLAPLVESGDVVIDFLHLDRMKAELPASATAKEQLAWMIRSIDAFGADLFVACRYHGAFSPEIIAHLRKTNTPIVYHIDDDLLNVPREIGEKKYLEYRSPKRLFSIRYFLENSDLIYCSTGALMRRFRDCGFRYPIVHGEVYCASTVMNRAQRRQTRKMGYMGFDHAHDFNIALPSIIRALERHEHLEFELFGSIPMPEVLKRFGQRVRSIPPVRVYSEFMNFFASLNWDIGICPLVNSPFNLVKANTKWVEYTTIGAAVIASRETVYDHCGRDGRAMLVSDDGWDSAIEALVVNPDARYQAVLTAQNELETHYSEDRLRNQILNVFQIVFDIKFHKTKHKEGHRDFVSKLAPVRSGLQVLSNA